MKDTMLEIVNELKAELMATLRLNNSNIHLCLDDWTAPNNFAFIAVTVHFVDQHWHAQEHLLGFYEPLITQERV